MDIIAWILDPAQFQVEIANAYWGSIYGAVDDISFQLTQMGYPPR
ncbi:hypothetical protein [Hoyosella rhizosphaerae]|uniref:Uncharacterized protein n=1 Tax=Hoyosella rhizosphaerae TaxID=1755582 RepID=A0A916XG12_9ACTN|nr:hypothetical protein [Hoyosella rhizosphaerae]GGC69211.1 hypothetical protein GCM10011410_22540 [Hoyosella rhizosphaerae]